ncbi:MULTISPECIES: FHA domain-containing protein [unclassified Streptomyces]|uniref:FHA domain-containing protein n=1 Tax=unclassified Streptomyces TaxID=2593676 RepID=UPI001661290C|nr:MULTISPECIES: FHA domain-containing protein [unclassified Streptomyces]MBD0709546.1 peptide-binding protein [Streptomyces sp. CBMA291]MBD0716924.1 peptide-binding protein [Streptomyces sp. CBMA370]
MTTPFELPANSPRVTDTARDRALVLLREGAAQGRLSHDTFLFRMERALQARRPDELALLTADLRSESGWSRRVVGAVEKMSAFTARIGRAWHAERLPKLLLPMPGPHPLRIGRDPVNGLRLSHETTSRLHAELFLQAGMWVLRDLGSTNGTTVNGRRVTGAVVVRPGDVVGFGEMTFRLSYD